MHDVKPLIAQAKQTPITDELISLAVSCLDYTSLNDTDTDDDIRTLCQRAITPKGNVAAICLYPQFVDFAKRELADASVKIATVANFPEGTTALDAVISDVKASLFDGTDEIDVVLPYRDYLASNKTAAVTLIKAVKHACGNKCLKVILETGELKDSEVISTASTDCLTAGADFLKTSTGKVATGATLEAAATMLQAIKTYQTTNTRTVGFKASGGVRSVQDAINYIALANLIMGSDWVTPQTFRIGASSLLDALLKA